MTNAQLRPFIWMAWLGVATTAINTGMRLLPSSSGLDQYRDLILLIHAPATLFPVIGVVLLSWRHSPFAAALAVACTLLEKSIEFIGQTIILFPPTAGGSLPDGGSSAMVWDQMFLVLWSCNTAGAAAVGLLLNRWLAGQWRWVAAAGAWGAALMTLLLLLRGYGLIGLPVPPAWLFFLLFTAYRMALALSLSWRRADGDRLE